MEFTRSPQTAYLVQQGIAAARSGRSAEARQLLQQVIHLNPQDEMAWLWLSGLVSTLEQKSACLQQVLRINPQNAYARAGLVRLQSVSPSVAPQFDELEARMAGVTGGPVVQKELQSPSASPKDESASPAIKRLASRPSATEPENSTPKPPVAPSSGPPVCPACDRPISLDTRICPHCYIQLKSLEELLARGDPLPPTQPLKPKRKGLFGSFFG